MYEQPCTLLTVHSTLKWVSIHK